MITRSLVRRGLVAVLLATAALAGCGDNLKPTDPDAATDAPPAICGNNVVEAGEDCDDGDFITDAVCDDQCRFTCGNGDVDTGFGETCDVGIASGPGACPTTCDDGMDCTADVMSGSECTAACLSSPITTPANGDGCCPPGENANTDDDCAPACGNAAVEPGETCDTGIAAGNGACPSAAACVDGRACTRDVLDGAGTCTAACSNPAITAPMNGDGCCPPGATPATDTDCVLGCGNGVVDPGETCDTAIAIGPGSCPTTCSDGMSCTRDVLSGGGTCTATCTFPPITAPMNNDNCCPAGANANNDNDCPPRCLNGVVEAGEQCDDGNMNPSDACNNACMFTTVVPTAFRMNDLDLRDPHIFVNFLGCRDVTDTPLVGFSVNGEIQTNIQTDGDQPPDNILDLSIAAVFRPLNQAGTTNAIEIHFPTCTTPLATTMCRRMPASAAPVPATATNMSAASCLTPLAGTIRPYSPAITSTASPCFVSNQVTVTIMLAGIPITLRDTRIAATYVGNPATNLVNGLLMGFISEADANATILPSTLPLVGGQRLSTLLAGGTGSCPSHNDKDVNGGVMGWWFYLNFTAPRVTWMDN